MTNVATDQAQDCIVGRRDLHCWPTCYSQRPPTTAHQPQPNLISNPQMHHLHEESLRGYNSSSCDFWVIITTLVKWQSEHVVTQLWTHNPPYAAGFMIRRSSWCLKRLRHPATCGWSRSKIAINPCSIDSNLFFITQIAHVIWWELAIKMARFLYSVVKWSASNGYYQLQFFDYALQRASWHYQITSVDNNHFCR